MGVFDDLGKRVSDLGQQTVAKTKEWTDSSKLNSMISEEQKKLEQNYYFVGKLYVDKHPDDYEPEFASTIKAIFASQDLIKSYSEQIRDIKGVQVCEKCGAEVPRGVAFCSSCGAPVPKIEKKADSANMVQCASCGNFIPRGTKFCTYCGTAVVETAVPASGKKLCSTCGAEIADGALFCTKCGSRQA